MHTSSDPGAVKNVAVQVLLLLQVVKEDAADSSSAVYSEYRESLLEGISGLKLIIGGT